MISKIIRTQFLLVRYHHIAAIKPMGSKVYISQGFSYVCFPITMVSYSPQTSAMLLLPCPRIPFTILKLLQWKHGTARRGVPPHGLVINQRSCRLGAPLCIIYLYPNHIPIISHQYAIIIHYIIPLVCNIQLIALIFSFWYHDSPIFFKLSHCLVKSKLSPPAPAAQQPRARCPHAPKLVGWMAAAGCWIITPLGSTGDVESHGPTFPTPTDDSESM